MDKGDIQTREQKIVKVAHTFPLRSDSPPLDECSSALLVLLLLLLLLPDRSVLASGAPG